MNIKLLLADSDTVYAQRLFDSLSSDARFTVSIFTDKAKMISAVKAKQYNVVLYDDEMSDISLSSIPVKIMLCDTEQAVASPPLPESFMVNKYQRVSNIEREIMGKYAELTPNVAAFSTRPVKIVSVYSPIGGSGKTTVAVAAALSAVKENMRSLYVGLETYSSINSFVNTQAGNGLSEIFSKLDADINFTAKLESLLLDYKGLKYFDGFSNARDVAQVTEEDIEKLIDIITKANICDVLVFDLDSSYSTVVTAILKHSDCVVLVADSSNVSQGKLKKLEQQYNFSSLCGEKLKLISNKGARAEYANNAGFANIGKYALENPFDIAMAISAEISATKLLK